jgi:hypothetical protein
MDSWLGYSGKPARRKPSAYSLQTCASMYLSRVRSAESVIKGNGMIPSSMRSAEELPQFLASEIARWRRDLDRIGLAGSQ